MTTTTQSSSATQWTIALHRVRARPEGKRGTYVAHFEANGHHCKKSLKTRRRDVALKAAVLLEAQLQSAGYAPAPAKMSIENAAAEFLNAKTIEGISAKTATKYRRELSEFTRFCSDRGVHYLQNVDEAIFTAYRAARTAQNLVKPGARLHEKTIFLSLMIIRGLFKWCRSRRYISTNPLAEIQVKKPAFRPQFCPTLKEVNAVLAAAPDSLIAALSVLAFTGMRSGELKLLRPADFDLVRNVITVQTLKAKLTRLRPLRMVPIHPRLRTVLETHAKHLLDSDLVFLFTAAPSSHYPLGGHNINTKHLNERLQKVVARLALPVGRAHDGFVIHSFRHFFETTAINSGIPQRVVDAWLGHTGDRSMGSVYYRLNDDESQLQMQKVRFESSK